MRRLDLGISKIATNSLVVLNIAAKEILKTYVITSIYLELIYYMWMKLQVFASIQNWIRRFKEVSKKEKYMNPDKIDDLAFEVFLN